MNQKRISEIAGVSVATVSKAFSNSSEISEKTRNHIFEIAKREDCFSKYYSDKYDKKVIALIAPEIKNNNYSKGIMFLDESIKKRGDIMTASFYNFSNETASLLIDYYSNFSKVDGIILLGSNKKIRYVSSVPLICIDSQGAYGKADVINSDVSDSINEAILHFKEMGHEKIAYIGELYTETKRKHFEAAIKRNGLVLDKSMVRVSHNRHEAAGFSQMEALLSLSTRPTAIFAAYDTIAFGAIQAIKCKNLRVPENFSVIGMNDVEEASFFGTELTTIQEDTEAVFETAIDLLYKRIDGNCTLPRRAVTVKARLIKRGTVANPV